MSAEITLSGVTLNFRVYRNQTPSMKEAFLAKILRKKEVSEVVEFRALDDLSIALRGGDRLGVIGLNGAGKSTFLKLIAGIYHPHQGSVTVKGRVTPLTELGTGFDTEQNGIENIFLNGSLLGLTPSYLRTKVQDIAEFSELGDFLSMPVKYYSSGMFARLAFSIATMTDPEILLLDEILSIGDQHFVSKALARMKRLINVSQIVVFVSHNMDQVREVCNRVIVLHKGKLVFDGPTEQAIRFYEKQIAV